MSCTYCHSSNKTTISIDAGCPHALCRDCMYNVLSRSLTWPYKCHWCACYIDVSRCCKVFSDIFGFLVQRHIISLRCPKAYDSGVCCMFRTDVAKTPYKCRKVDPVMTCTNPACLTQFCTGCRHVVTCTAGHDGCYNPELHGMDCKDPALKKRKVFEMINFIFDRVRQSWPSCPYCKTVMDMGRIRDGSTRIGCTYCGLEYCYVCVDAVHIPDHIPKDAVHRVASCVKLDVPHWTDNSRLSITSTDYTCVLDPQGCPPTMADVWRIAKGSKKGRMNDEDSFLVAFQQISVQQFKLALKAAIRDCRADESSQSQHDFAAALERVRHKVQKHLIPGRPTPTSPFPLPILVLELLSITNAVLKAVDHVPLRKLMELRELQFVKPLRICIDVESSSGSDDEHESLSHRRSPIQLTYHSPTASQFTPHSYHTSSVPIDAFFVETKHTLLPLSSQNTLMSSTPAQHFLSPSPAAKRQKTFFGQHIPLYNPDTLPDLPSPSSLLSLPSTPQEMDVAKTLVASSQSSPKSPSKSSASPSLFPILPPPDPAPLTISPAFALGDRVMGMLSFIQFEVGQLVSNSVDTTFIQKFSCDLKSLDRCAEFLRHVTLCLTTNGLRINQKNRQAIKGIARNAIDLSETVSLPQVEAAMVQFLKWVCKDDELRKEFTTEAEWYFR